MFGKLKKLLGVEQKSIDTARMALPMRPMAQPLQQPTMDNQITNNLVRQGRLPMNQSEVYPQGMTQDNMITNSLVNQGRLPAEQAEIYPTRYTAPRRNIYQLPMVESSGLEGNSLNRFRRMY